MVVQIKKHPINFMKTCSLYTVLMMMGMGWTIIGPTLLDLKTQVNRELNEVAVVLPSASGGSALRSVIMGFIFEKVNYQLFSFIMGMTALFMYLCLS